MSQHITICCSFIKQFNLNCGMKLLTERRVVTHRKLISINRFAKQAARMIRKITITDS